MFKTSVVYKFTDCIACISTVIILSEILAHFIYLSFFMKVFISMFILYFFIDQHYTSHEWRR